jgi:hypothetical protein
VDAFNWLHLTDLHWGLRGQKHLWPTIRQKFFDDLQQLYPHTGPWHAVLFTGDFVQRGAKEEFESLENEILGPLWEQFQQLHCDPVLMAVPGNHDLERPSEKMRKAAVRWLKTPGRFQEIAEEFWNDAKSEYRRVIDRAFANYQAWWSTRPHCTDQPIRDGVLSGDFSTTFTTSGGHTVGVVGLNVTFLQLSDAAKEGDLACDVRQFHAACEPNGVDWAQRQDVCLLMTHQPPAWLDNVSRSKHYPEINPAGRFAAHLFGHMHEEALRGFSHGGGPLVRWWQGCSLFGLEQYGDQDKEDRRHGYAAGRLLFEADRVTLRHWPRAATFDPVNGWRFVRDEFNCVLRPDDGGTEPEVIPLRRKTNDSISAAPLAPSDTLAADIARVLGNYHQSVQQEWNDRWSGVIGDE